MPSQRCVTPGQSHSISAKSRRVPVVSCATLRTSQTISAITMMILSRALYFSFDAESVNLLLRHEEDRTPRGGAFCEGLPVKHHKRRAPRPEKD